MAGLPQDLYSRCRNLLLRCDIFASNMTLQAIFADARIHSWSDMLPQASTRVNRVKYTIDYLRNEYNATYQNALVLLLRVLSENINRNSSLYRELVEMANQLESVLQAPPPLSVTNNQHKTASKSITQEGVISALCDLLQESSELKLIIEGYRDNLYSPYNDFSKYDIDQARKHRDMPGLDIEDIVRAAARTREGLVPLIEKASQKPCLPETKCKLQTIQRNWEMCRGGLQSMQSIQDKRKPYQRITKPDRFVIANPTAVILTTMRDERKAIWPHLSNIHDITDPSTGDVYDVGEFKAKNYLWRIVILESGPGNVMASSALQRAIAYFQPQVALLVGVAGGVKDVKLGDVVVATKVCYYESGKDADTFKYRPIVLEDTNRMVQRARADSIRKNWRQRIQTSNHPTESSEVFVKPIAAGEKVVADTRSQTYQLIRQVCSDALAVEMEGIGFLQTVYVNLGIEAIIVRGISDLIQDKELTDKQGYQEIAANHASAFAFEVLANLVLKSSWEAI